MQLRTAKAIGATIRDRRKKQGLDQAALAAMIGVSRKWIIDIEKGKPRAAVSLILKALDALGVALFVDSAEPTSARHRGVDIDAIVEKAKGRKR